MHRQRVFLLESNQRFADAVRVGLQERGFAVWQHQRGDSLGQALRCNAFDAIVVSLSGQVDFTLIQTVRQNFAGPFLILSELDDLRTQLRAFELGVDDVIVKPVDIRILLARLSVCLRLYGTQARSATECSSIRVQNLTVDRNNHRVLIKDRPMPVSTAEFELLWMFATHPQQPLSREFLFVHALGRQYDGLDRTIDRRVSRLRKKLDASADVALTVRTVWGKGYMLAGK